MNENRFQLIRAADNYDLVRQASARIGSHWPEFMLHDPVADLLEGCYERLPQYQFVLRDSSGGDTVAIANSIPLSYDGEIDDLPDEGWDWALAKGIDDLDNNRTPNILCALQIVVFDEFRGLGISRHAVLGMKSIAADHGLHGLIAPVRPNRKHEDPTESIDDYILRKNEDGAPFDSWLRVHWSLGARIVKPCHHAMTICGPVAEWESWTGMTFEQSGNYNIPGALLRVEIDKENDIGCYIEPNVWMYHP
jgi:hypothetical protein